MSGIVVDKSMSDTSISSPTVSASYFTDMKQMTVNTRNLDQQGSIGSIVPTEIMATTNTTVSLSPTIATEEVTTTSKSMAQSNYKSLKYVILLSSLGILSLVI